MDDRHEKFSNYLESLGFEKNDDDLLDDDDPCLKFMYEFGQIVVVLHTNESKFDIYYNFAYPDVPQEKFEEFPGIEAATQFKKYEELYQNLLEDISKYWKGKALQSVVGRSPKEEFDESCLYCPGVNEYLGYFACDIESDHTLPKQFISIYRNEPNYSVDDVRTLVINVLSDYLMEHGYTKADNMSFNHRINRVRILLDSSQLHIRPRGRLKNVKAVYYGKEYRLFLSVDSNRIAATENGNFEAYEDLCQLFSWFSKENIQLDSANRLVVSNGLFYMEIESYTDDPSCRNLEYLHLMDSLEKFQPFRPSADLQILDFTRLTPDEFEKLCYDYLISSGFQNVHPIGKTMAADGGKDILAEYVLKGPAGTEILKYIVQCKHSKTSLSRDKITEIPELLRENNANKYLLICSNDIAPQAIDRLVKLNERFTNSIAYWGKVEFSTQLFNYPRLIHQYKLLPDGSVPMKLIKYE